MKVLLFVLMSVLIASVSFADDITIPTESRPSVNKARLDTIVIHDITKEASVTLRKGYEQNGEFVSVGEKTVVYTGADYDALMAAINLAGLKNVIKNKLK